MILWLFVVPAAALSLLRWVFWTPSFGWMGPKGPDLKAVLFLTASLGFVSGFICGFARGCVGRQDLRGFLLTILTVTLAFLSAGLVGFFGLWPLT